MSNCITQNCCFLIIDMPQTQNYHQYFPGLHIINKKGATLILETMNVDNANLLWCRYKRMKKLLPLLLTWVPETSSTPQTFSLTNSRLSLYCPQIQVLV